MSMCITNIFQIKVLNVQILLEYSKKYMIISNSNNVYTISNSNSIIIIFNSDGFH